MSIAKKMGFLSLRFAVCAGLLLAAAPAFAAGDAGTVTISRLQVWVNGDILIYTAAGFGNPDGCTLASRVVLPSTSNNYNLLMTMLYDAYVNGDQVDFYVKGCTTEGNYTDPTVAEFSLQKS